MAWFGLGARRDDSGEGQGLDGMVRGTVRG